MIKKKFPRTPGFLGERLVQAREARGLTTTGLAKLIGVSPQTISQCEHNIQTPRPETLEKLSSTLNLPKHFFLREIVHRAGERVFYRSMSSATKSARSRAKRRYEWLKEIVHYLREYFDFVKTNLPTYNAPKDFRKITYEQIEFLAEECRSHWELGGGPIDNIVKILECNGILVTRGNLQAETLDAFSEFDEENQPYIFLGADKNIAVRSRFDASHELGHLILHKHIDKSNISNSKDFKLIEDQAHYFAGAFMLPATEFKNDLWAPTLNAFRSLKERWKMSISAMIKRSEQLDLIDKDQAKRLFINLSRRGWKKFEPQDETLLIENPILLGNCFETLITFGVKTKEKILQEIFLSSNDIEELANLPKGYFKPNKEQSLSASLKQKMGSRFIPNKKGNLN